MIMANASQDLAILYCSRWVDVFVQERSVADYSDERLSSMRMMIGPKPLSFVGARQPKDPSGLEATLRRLLLFGMAPGSEKAEHERALYRKYMPIIAKVALSRKTRITAAARAAPPARARGGFMPKETKIAILAPIPARARGRALGEAVGVPVPSRALVRSQTAGGKQAQAGKFQGGT